MNLERLPRRAQTPTPISVILHSQDADDAARVAFAERVIGGVEPFTEDFVIPGFVDPEGLVPDGFETVLDLRGHLRATLLRTATATVLLKSFSDFVAVEISATDAQVLEQVVSLVRAKALEALGDTTQQLDVSFWWQAPRGGGTRSVRPLEVDGWGDASLNYPQRVRQQLQPLMELGPPDGTARLMLWHGEPGTGKTSAALALLDAWSEWCTGHVVSDPERMFHEVSYLQEVLACDAEPARQARLGRSPEQRRRWKLIIAEDADEYLRSDARARSGPALGRLLNTSDGILG